MPLSDGNSREMTGNKLDRDATKVPRFILQTLQFMVSILSPKPVCW